MKNILINIGSIGEKKIIHYIEKVKSRSKSMNKIIPEPFTILIFNFFFRQCVTIMRLESRLSGPPTLAIFLVGRKIEGRTFFKKTTKANFFWKLCCLQ